MEKKSIGIIIIAFSIAIALYTAWITADLKKLNQYLHQSCTLPADVCPFNTLLPSESIIGFIIAILLGAFGSFVILTGRMDMRGKIIESKKVEQSVKSLIGDDKTVYNTVASSGGTIFQSELVEKSGLDKVKVSRVLDKLEGRGLIERKRRGMSNVIVLKH